MWVISCSPQSDQKKDGTFVMINGFTVLEYTLGSSISVTKYTKY